MLALLLIVRGAVTLAADLSDGAVHFVQRGQAYAKTFQFGYHALRRRPAEFRMTATTSAALTPLRASMRQSFGVPDDTGYEVYCVDTVKLLCECADAWWRGVHCGVPCKHCVAVRLLLSWGLSKEAAIIKASSLLADMVRVRERRVPHDQQISVAASSNDDAVIAFILQQANTVTTAEVPSPDTDVHDLRGVDLVLPTKTVLESKARHEFRGTSDSSLQSDEAVATPVAPVYDPKCPANLRNVVDRLGVAGRAKQHEGNASKISRRSKVSRGFAQALASEMKEQVEDASTGKANKANKASAKKRTKGPTKPRSAYMYYIFSENTVRVKVY
jgi:hypothetical protein